MERAQNVVERWCRARGESAWVRWQWKGGERASLGSVRIVGSRLGAACVGAFHGRGSASGRLGGRGVGATGGRAAKGRQRAAGSGRGAEEQRSRGSDVRAQEDGSLAAMIA